MGDRDGGSRGPDDPAVDTELRLDAVPEFIARWSQWLFPPETRYRVDARWLMIAAFIGTQILASYIMLLPLYYWALPDSFPGIPLLLLVVALGVELARRGRLRASEFALTSGLFGLYLVTIYASGGARSPAAVLLVTVPSVPLSLRQDRAAMAWGVIAVAAAALLHVPPIDTFMAQGAPRPEVEPFLLPWFVAIATMVATASVLQVAAASLHLATQLNSAVRDLRATTKAAEAANQAKGVFLASMSHEIRTPMNGVLGTARLLAHTELTPEQRDYVRTLDESASALLGILDDILDFSRIEAGVVQLRSVVFQPEEVARCVSSLLAMPAREKGIELTVDLSDVPAWVRGDPSRLRQVLVNLIGNAVKYTEHGFVHLRAQQRESATPGRLRLRWEVTDSGVGIPPDALDHVFDRFVRGSDRTARESPGTGLGLSIVQGIVQAMGGSVEVRSTVGVGSTFAFEIEVEPAAEERPPLVLPATAGGLPRVRALVVEDNPVNMRVARAMLEKLGCEAEGASNGKLGVELAMKERFDIIFMDCAMPVMDGYEATRALRAGVGATPMSVPIVAMTADVLPSTRDACTRAGMTAFVAKPTTFEMLRAVVSELCGQELRVTEAV